MRLRRVAAKGLLRRKLFVAFCALKVERAIGVDAFTILI